LGVFLKKFFFERQQEARNELPTTFTYDVFPPALKTQIELIWKNQGDFEYSIVNEVKKLRVALGRHELADGSVPRVGMKMLGFIRKNWRDFLTRNRI
jgi:hypothetical protein